MRFWVFSEKEKGRSQSSERIRVPPLSVLFGVILSSFTPMRITCVTAHLPSLNRNNEGP